MLSLVQTKTLDAIEYALLLIEQYDQEFQKKVKRDEVEEGKKDDQGKSGDFEARFSDVKTSCQTLFTLQKERAVNFVTGSTIYKYADQRIDFGKRYTDSVELTGKVWTTLNTKIVVPLHKNVVFIYDTSWKSVSIIVENLQNNFIAQAIAQRFSSARITLSQNWMRLDFDQDGKVTMSDIGAAINSIKDFVAQCQCFQNAMELPQSVRQKALGYIQNGKSGDDQELEKRLNSESSHNSNESNEEPNALENVD